MKILYLSIISVLIISTSVTTNVFGQNMTNSTNFYANPGPPPDPIFVVDNRNQIDNFLTNYEILIHYNANPVISGSSPLKLEIKLANNGNLILDDKKYLTLNDTHQTVVFWRFVPTLPGNYTLEKYNNGIHTSTTYFTVSDSKETLTSPVLVSPFKQMQAQIPMSNIECESSYKLVIKSEDNSPACVKPETAKILYERGWALVLSVNLDNSNSNQPVDVISILSDSSLTNPGGPPVKITIKNNGIAPITSLKATLHLNNEYVFDFANVTQSKPLTIGNLTSDSKILIGAGFDNKLAYLLTISGIANKTPFNFTENVWIYSTSENSAKEHSVNAKVPDSFVVCDTPYEYKQGFIPVLNMPTNSDGRICVNYWNPNHPRNASLTIFDAKSYHVEKSITTWAEPDLIPVGNSTVTYTIKTGNQTGFYGVTVFCVGMPFAIGYDNNSNMSINDFPWEKQQTINCPMMDFQFKVLATKNIGIKYIPYP